MRLKILFVSLLICSAGFAQDFVLKRKIADGYFNSFDFYKAIPMYNQLLKSHPEDETLYERLATIYDRINDSENAEKCYAFLVTVKEVKPEHLLNYARALSRNGKYDLAVRYYAKYKEVRPNDPRGETFAAAYRNIGVFYKDSAAFTIKKAPFSTEADDFSPAYFGKSIVFSSDRTSFSMVRSNYNWTDSHYLDLYQAKSDGKEAAVFSRELNSVYHEGPVSFSKNQDTIFFTRSNYFRSHLHKSTDGVNKLSLFMANWDKGQNKWVNVQPLSLNNDEYSVEHPALSPDGSRLYFASDMPGGYGGMDLYVSQRITEQSGAQSWGMPINLGAEINSPGYDLFPFIDKQGNLWYASNGIPGLGGLDIFFAAQTDQGFAKTINPGYPMNTRFDDFGFITDSEGENGYLSSDRNNHYGNDDIYSLFRPFRRFAVQVIDARTKLGLPSVQIDVAEQGFQTGGLYQADAKPVFLKVNPYKSYLFGAKKAKYKAAEIALNRIQLMNTDTLKIPLNPIGPLFQLVGKVVRADDQSPVANSAIALVNPSVSSPMEITSDGNGIFKAELQPESDYLLKLVNSKDSKCRAESITLSTKGVLQDSIYRVTIPLYCTGDIIRLGDIYYDLDQSAIRSDAATVLDRLFKLMNEYPKMKIELRSHTDSRASSAYNLALSEKRAKSAAAYLVSKGIDKNRISGKGFGETMLINKCQDGIPCSDAEHQLNRRTEFRIVKIE